MITSKYPRGSEWRKWDLHIHTPVSKHFIGTFKDLLRNINKTECVALGINDYATLQGYEKIKNDHKKEFPVLFPVVEFRMHNIVTNRKSVSGGVKINFHLIFNNSTEIYDKVKTFVNSIDCYNEKGDSDQLGNIKDSSLPKITIDFEHVIKKLNELNLRKEVLIWLPYDEYGGVDNIDPDDNFFKLGLIRKTDIIGSSTKKQIDFFNWKDEKFTEEEYKNWFEYRKPCIKGSDCHDANYPLGSLKNEKSQPINRFCWIKSDPTFEGLKQILYEPERAFIGLTPHKLEYVENNKEFFIDSIKINTTNDDNEWFDKINTKISINPGLVSIIGNKGHGKSALADIIASLSNANQKDYSFLNSERFLDFERVDKYSADIKYKEAYQNGKKFRKVDYDPKKAIKSKYLSQHFVNNICDDLYSSNLQNEINKVVFSHLPEEIQGNYDDLRKLATDKVKPIEDNLERERKNLSKINVEIARSEFMNSTDEKERLKNLYKNKQEEIKAHLQNKPKPVNKPKESKKVDELAKKSDKAQNELSKVQRKINELTKEKTELRKVIDSFKNIENAIIDLFEEYEENNILNKYKLNLKNVFTYKFNYKKLDEKIVLINNKIKAEGKTRKEKQQEIKDIKTKIDNLNKSATRQQKEYTDYISKNNKWKEKNRELQGAKNKEGSLLYYEDKLRFIEKELPKQLDDLKVKRVKRVEKIVDLLFQKQKVSPEIYKSAQEFAEERANEFMINKDEFISFDSKLKLTDRIFNEFYDMIDGTRKGSYYHDSNQQILTEVIKKSSFNTKEDLLKFATELEKSFKYDYRLTEEDKESLDYESFVNQFRNKELYEIYDYIYSFNYIDTEFDITYGGKSIKELSPGERGTLLLIFYLIIDKDKNPIIIDQPEENLDNETIFVKLVPFIKKVKEERQVIIVTHNPNLAIVCDSEQIIHAYMDKKNNNLISYNSGSIEFYKIREKAIDILEGTETAFVNRKMKYAIK